MPALLGGWRTSSCRLVEAVLGACEIDKLPGPVENVGWTDAVEATGCHSTISWPGGCSATLPTVPVGSPNVAAVPCKAASPWSLTEGSLVDGDS